MNYQGSGYNPEPAKKYEDNMNMLTEFQKRCEDKLENCLLKIGSRMQYRHLLEMEETSFADRETYIMASVDRLKIWIYEDEAEIGVGERHIHFEAPDYDTEDDLIRAFTDRVISFFKR